ncbi:MAG: glycosyltransferase [Verrucomicrobiota bacterium]
MRLLISTVSPARYMAPPRLADEQVMCGPDWPDACAPDGRWISLQTPVGEYELASVLERLPADQQPDAVVCLVDASWRNQPRNVGVFAGPKALLIADTHHLQSPLIAMFQYVAAETFDRIVFLYDRHHADFFRSVGLENVFWFPGLTFPHDDATVRAARRARRQPHVAFVGQVGKHHPRRAHLIEAMKLCRVPLDVKALSQKDSLAHYGGALLGFNASLNADLNLRVFEILSSGAALLTDRLAPQSGLAQLWTEGRELLTYSCADDLVERIEHALAHPAETAAIGAAGARWFDTHFNAARRRAEFTSLLFDGVAPEQFALPPRETTRVFFGGDTDRLLQTLMVYEGVQELHRKQESVRLAFGPTVPADVGEIFSTLPRVIVNEDTSTATPDLAIFGRDEASLAIASGAARAWCWDAQPQDFSVLADQLAGARYDLVSEDVAVFCQAAPEVGTNVEAPATVATTAAAPDILLYTEDPVV